MYVWRSHRGQVRFLSTALGGRPPLAAAALRTESRYTGTARCAATRAAAAWPKRHQCVYTRTGYLGPSSGASFDTALQYISLSSDTRGYLPVPVQLYRYLVVPVTKLNLLVGLYYIQVPPNSISVAPAEPSRAAVLNLAPVLNLDVKVLYSRGRGTEMICTAVCIILYSSCRPPTYSLYGRTRTRSRTCSWV